MDKIAHKFLQINRLKLHIAEIGPESSPAVIFLHGFPEIWYTWRHQMIAVANAGFRAIAPDFRGYGLSNPPAEPEKASYNDFVNDIVSILDFLAISKVFVIAKDFGTMIAYPLVLQYPQKIAGIVTLNMAFMPPAAFKNHPLPEGFYVTRWRIAGIVTLNMAFMPPAAFKNHPLPEGFYVTRWREPGRAEADFSRFDVKTVVRNIYIMFSQSKIPIANENEEIMDLVKPLTPLPSWFTEEDLAIYGDLYEKSGFQTALQVPYRSYMTLGPIDKVPKVEAPMLLIMGEDDYGLKVPGMHEYIKSGDVKKFVPNIETVYVPHGCHFVHEQFPDKVNHLILTFLDHNKHLSKE